MKSSIVSVVATAALSISAGVEAAKIQKAGLRLPPGAAVHAQTAKNAFSSAFNQYKTYAWGHDDLAPVSKSFV